MRGITKTISSILFIATSAMAVEFEGIEVPTKIQNVQKTPYVASINKVNRAPIFNYISPIEPICNTLSEKSPICNPQNCKDLFYFIGEVVDCIHYAVTATDEASLQNNHY